MTGPTFKVATTVPVLCWCQSCVVLVSPARVRAGFTEPCWKKQCQEMADQRQRENSG